MLRHFIGVAFGVALAAAIFFGGGWGVAHMTHLSAQSISLTSISGLSALGILLLVGLFLGILMVAPVSPLSTALPGAVMLAWTGLLGLDARLAARIIPLRSTGYACGIPRHAGQWRAGPAGHADDLHGVRPVPVAARAAAATTAGAPTLKTMFPAVPRRPACSPKPSR